MSHASRGSVRTGAAGNLAPNGHPVLAARFTVPGVSGTYIRRPRATDCLTRAMAGPDRLVLVNGPAGAGKTWLVADWAGRAAPPAGRVVWLTAESGDNAPGIFWAYVLAALRHQGVALPEGVAGPAGPGAVDDSLLSRLAAHLNARREPVILVLDDFERVAAPEIADGLQFVLHHAGQGLRLLLVSRTEPLLPLHRYRASGELTEIRAADLAFLPGETAALARRHGLSLSDEAARTLTERTGGWAAGLRLCIHAAQRTDDPERFLKEFETGDSTIADFLLSEVLETQSRVSQDLLLRTSICERVHPGLANALTGRDDAALVLAELQRSNAFVEPAGHSWYRMHPLFSETLRARLRTAHPGLERELHSMAARWLSGAGLLTTALPHAADAGDWTYAADRLVDELAIGQLLTGPDADRLRELFTAMAPDTQGPAADLVRAACELARQDTDRGLASLDRAEAHLPAADTEQASAAHLSCALLRVLAGHLLGSVDMAESAARRAEELGGREDLSERLEAHPEIRGLWLAALGSARLWAGRFGSARSALAAAVDASDGPSTALSRHDSLDRLALIDFLDGWPDRAEGRARQAIVEAERSGVRPPARTSLGRLVLASVDIERDDLSSARTHVDRAVPPSPAHGDPVGVFWLAVTRSRLLLAGGHAAEALRVLDDLRETPSTAKPPPWVDGQVALAAAAGHLARGQPSAAVGVLAGRQQVGPEYAIAAAHALLAAGDEEAARLLVDTLPGPNGHGPGLTVRTLLVRAELARILGDEATARHLVARALSVARPQRLRRPFLEAGAWLRGTLDHLPATGQTLGWLPEGLLPETQTSHSGEPAPAPVTDPLTHREREVLELLAELRSTQEIAGELLLSVNTVKTHLRNIYRKLGVVRRGEAVRRARALRLL